MQCFSPAAPGTAGFKQTQRVDLSSMPAVRDEGSRAQNHPLLLFRHLRSTAETQDHGRKCIARCSVAASDRLEVLQMAFTASFADMALSPGRAARRTPPLRSPPPPSWSRSPSPLHNGTAFTTSHTSRTMDTAHAIIKAAAAVRAARAVGPGEPREHERYVVKRRLRCRLEVLEPLNVRRADAPVEPAAGCNEQS